MVSDLQLWFTLVQNYIDTEARIIDDTVYLFNGKDVPVFDPTTVLQLMNLNPHLTDEMNMMWRGGEEDMARAFCIPLYEHTAAALNQESLLAGQDVEAYFLSLLQAISGLVGGGAFTSQAEQIAKPVANNDIFQSACFSKN